MPTVVADNSSTADQIPYRKLEIDLIPNRPKTTISSILSSNPTADAASKKKNNFSSATFQGLGCAASQQVSVPAVIRTSANWESKKLKKKKGLKPRKTGSDQLLAPNPLSLSLALSSKPHLDL